MQVVNLERWDSWKPEQGGERVREGSQGGGVLSQPRCFWWLLLCPVGGLGRGEAVGAV